MCLIRCISELDSCSSLLCLLSVPADFKFNTLVLVRPEDLVKLYSLLRGLFKVESHHRNKNVEDQEPIDHQIQQVLCDLLDQSCVSRKLIIVLIDVGKHLDVSFNEIATVKDEQTSLQRMY